MKSNFPFTSMLVGGKGGGVIGGGGRRRLQPSKLQCCNMKSTSPFTSMLEDVCRPANYSAVS